MAAASPHSHREERNRPSLEVRLRGLSDDQAEHERRLKDFETYQQSITRRWGIIAGVLVLLVAGKMLGLVTASPAAIIGIAAGATAVNLVLATRLRRGWHAWWHVYALALFDVALISAVIFLWGPGGLIVGLLLAVLPYAFDQGRGVGEVLVLAAAAAYLAAATLHGATVIPQPHIYVETATFVAVGIVILWIPAGLIRRIRHTRDVVAEAERGHLGLRAPAERPDELGFLEQSLNRMLDELTATIAVVQHEADEVATFSEVLAVNAGEMLATGREVASAAATLSEAMKEQHKLAEDGRSEGTAAAEEADALRSRAEMLEFDARHLLSAAERGRDRVGRASETLVSLGGEVSTTAATVRELRELSDGIGEFAQKIGHIARRTRVLALNAAIEAAHAGEHREGFAAVADQVRELAGEAADSARLAADVISEIRAGIEVVASAMTSGEKRVHGVEEVAGEAQSALEEIHTGVNKAAELVRATAGDSKAQSERLGALAQRLARVAEISAESASSASTTAQQVTAQIRAMESLNQTSQQLAELAERLQGGIAKFSVMKPDQVTHEHVVPGTR